MHLQSGVLIIEAKNKSGTLITAKYAKEQEKKIFCLPGNIDIKNSNGTNELLKENAKLVTNINDVLEEITVKQIKKTNEPKINSEYKKVYDVLTNYPMHINEICKKVGAPMSEVNQIITMLEIEGLIKSLPNNEFVKE